MEKLSEYIMLLGASILQRRDQYLAFYQLFFHVMMNDDTSVHVIPVYILICTTSVQPKKSVWFERMPTLKSKGLADLGNSNSKLRC